MKSQSVSTILSLLFRSMAIILILSIAGFVTVSVISLHLHVLSDGRVVAHSHQTDHDEENNSKHQHTSDQHVILTALGNLLQGYDFPFCWTPAPITLIFSWIYFYSNDIISYLVVEDVNKRAPPQFISA